MRGGETEYKEDGLLGEGLLGLAQKRDGIVDDHVRIVVLGVVVSVKDPLAIHVDRVVVVARVLDQAAPLPPSGRDVGSVVFVEVLAEIACKNIK